MARIALYRLLSVIAVLWGAATLTFIAIKLIPGDPLLIMSGGDNVVDDAWRAAMKAKFGLDQPLWMQYLHYCGRALLGNFGESIQFRAPVTAVITDALGQTLELAISALLLAVLLATLNALATAGRWTGLRALFTGLELCLLSTPVYWTSIILLSIFSFHLHWFPVTGNDGWISLILPIIALSLPLTAILSQVLRDGMEEALLQPFTMTVRTRGVGETLLRLRHGLRHASLAASTLTGTMLGSLLSGSILTETVFGRAGLGKITLQAIASRDMPLILGLVMLSALAFVVINLLMDLIYLFIDPRLRNRAF